MVDFYEIDRRDACSQCRSVRPFTNQSYLFSGRSIGYPPIRRLTQAVIGIDAKVMPVGPQNRNGISAHFAKGAHLDFLYMTGGAPCCLFMTSTTLSARTHPSQVQKLIRGFPAIFPANIKILFVKGYLIRNCFQHTVIMQSRRLLSIRKSPLILME
jgi:hypothetical protein